MEYKLLYCKYVLPIYPSDLELSTFTEHQHTISKCSYDFVRKFCFEKLFKISLLLFFLAILIVWINFLKIRIQHLSTLLHFILINIAKKLTSTPTTMRIISLYNNLLMKHPLKTKIITAGKSFSLTILLTFTRINFCCRRYYLPTLHRKGQRRKTSKI